MKRFFGFTLVEVLITLTVLGVIATVLVINFRPNDYTVKANVAKALKVMNDFDNATSQIREVEHAKCPMSNFIINGEYALVGVDSDTNMRSLFKEYIKTEGDVIFCSNTDCSKVGLSGTVYGSKLAGNIYVGYKLYSRLTNCPSYYMPKEDLGNEINPSTNRYSGTKKCWGILYIDVNGNDGPNTYGKDIYKFGLDENGLVH